MKTKHNQTILLFIRYPETGQVKKRLTEELDSEIVNGLYQQFIIDELTTLQTLAIPFSIAVHPENSIPHLRTWLGPQFDYIPQQGNDLGERMKNGFSYPFNQGVHQVVLIGSDIPDLPREYFTEAFSELQNSDIVLGPSTDGGYYLIGMNHTRFTPLLFQNISWGTSSVLKKTLSQCQASNRTVHLLPKWSDIDTLSDLKQYIQRNNRKNSHTLSYIRSLPKHTQQQFTVNKKKP